MDVLRSQIVSTVMTDPVWTVEGYGDAAKNAPFVEEFHQWQQEVEGFQGIFARAVHLALIEPRSCIEVYEDTIRRPVRKTIRAALQIDPATGAALMGEDLKPKLQMGPDGKFVEVLDETTPSAEMEIDSWETACRGPRMRVIASRDFLTLPAHASDKTEVWGYAKRFWRRVDELEERVEAGQYDEEAVKQMGVDDERSSESTLSGTPLSVAAKDGTDVVEKELWELLVLRDFDGKGLRWYVITLHQSKQLLLRIQYDDIGRPRFFPLIPFPRPNSVEGYSYIGHKLITVIEEHTAWRNMAADDGSMQLNLPMKRKQGALWDPDDQPIGPKAVIDVRDMGEVQFMERQPNTAVAIERIRDAERAGERLSGINDASAGVTSQDKRTLGEVELITQQSAGRTSEAVKNIQETLEELAQVRHLLWKRALRDLDQGLEAPPSVAQNLALRQQQFAPPPPAPPTQTLLGLEQRAPDVSQALTNVRFTAQMLEGTFRFKPRGSVETADKNRQRAEFAQSMQSMAMLSQVNPMIHFILQTPQAAKTLMDQWARLFDVQDKQAFLGSEAVAAAQQLMQQAQQAQMMGAAGGGPGAPPPGPAGAPPPPSPPMGGPPQ